MVSYSDLRLRTWHSLSVLSGRAAAAGCCSHGSLGRGQEQRHAVFVLALLHLFGRGINLVKLTQQSHVTRRGRQALQTAGWGSGATLFI